MPTKERAPPPTRVIRTGAGLREALFDVLDGLRSGRITPNQAIAAAKVACQIVNTVKVEVEYSAHIANQKGVDGTMTIGTLQLGNEPAEVS